MKVWGRLGYHDHEMMEFQILRERNGAKSNITTLDLRRKDVNNFRNLLIRISCDTSLERMSKKIGLYLRMPLYKLNRHPPCQARNQIMVAGGLHG